MADKNKNFATMDSESFELKGSNKGRVVLNITENKSDPGVVLQGVKKSNELGFFASISNYLQKLSTINVQSKSTFFHLFSVMLNAGIPVIKALQSLSAQEKNKRLKDVIQHLSDMVEVGKSLSEAIEVYPQIFSDQEIGMIKSGEASGQLSKVMENLARDLEKAYMINKKVKSAMFYPSLILVLLVVVVSGMMIFVIPKLTELFTANNANLPLITKFVVALSDFMNAHKYSLLVSLLSVILFVLLFKKIPIGKYLWDKFKISVPIFGELMRKFYLARFSRTMSNLLDSNILIVRALEISANSIGNEVYRKRLFLAIEDIKQGIPLAENLTESDLFPPMMVNMIDVGEKTAQLGEISGKIANFYEAEVETSVATISKVIEPIILVVIGTAVAFVVAAIILPIIQISDLVGVV
jgi:type IV pilus assembly protein PilC